jgi:exonuclease V
MLYRALLADLANACDGDNARELLALHRLDARAELSRPVKRHARRSGAALARTLGQVLDALYAAAGRLPACAQRGQVRYLWQRDGSALGAVDVPWDGAWLERRMAAHLGMLRGAAGPAKVPLAEEWKCGHCMFWHTCRGPSHHQL